MLTCVIYQEPPPFPPARNFLKEEDVAAGRGLTLRIIGVNPTTNVVITRVEESSRKEVQKGAILRFLPHSHHEGLEPPWWHCSKLEGVTILTAGKNSDGIREII